MRVLKLFGDFWSLRIVEILNNRKLRFCQIERSLKDINPITLTARLRKLEKQKIIINEKGTIDRISVVYSLTKSGQEMIPIIKKMKTYSEKYL